MRPWICRVTATTYGRTHIYIYIYIYVHISLSVYIYIYVRFDSKRERERGAYRKVQALWPSLASMRHVTFSTNPAFIAFHKCVQTPSVIQDSPAKLTRSSSHRFLGRPTFLCGCSLNHGVHDNNRVLHLPSVKFAVLPARSNFRARCISTQSSTPPSKASWIDLRVALCIYGTQSSLGNLSTRTIHRNILRWG